MLPLSIVIWTVIGLKSDPTLCEDDVFLMSNVRPRLLYKLLEKYWLKPERFLSFFFWNSWWEQLIFYLNLWSSHNQIFWWFWLLNLSYSIMIFLVSFAVFVHFMRWVIRPSSSLEESPTSLSMLLSSYHTLFRVRLRLVMLFLRILCSACLWDFLIYAWTFMIIITLIRTFAYILRLN